MRTNCLQAYRASFRRDSDFVVHGAIASAAVYGAMLKHKAAWSGFGAKVKLPQLSVHFRGGELVLKEHLTFFGDELRSEFGALIVVELEEREEAHEDEGGGVVFGYLVFGTLYEVT